MATITLNYNDRNTSLRKAIEFITSLKGIKVMTKTEEERLKDTMENKLREGERDFKSGNYRVIKTADLWK
mgnify:CR=1 FL=1